MVEPASPPPWAAVRSLLEQALALPAAQRSALLADPALDAALVADVRSLLAHESTGSDFLARPAAAQALLDAEPDSAREGQQLGAWRIVSRLGSGGMGEVWLAERADGAYAGQAAVKVLKRGMDSASVLARFAQEQQALARLQHPNIAHLIDAGRTADGLPYFVMERVQGRPIDQACAGLAPRERVLLFLQLADAVAHAHRNLLVHRDLKPSNAMVTATGQVKLLDFGIAKALDPLEGSDGFSTVAGDRPYTPHYASPEQVRGEPVSTATDVYSLGVLLYVMLTGQRPYGRQAATGAEAARAVLEESPIRPSAVATLGAGGGTLVRRALQGDLDNILLKAIEKPIDRRYASVDALAADLRAWLGGYPVSARRASAAYVGAKFVARHRWAVLASALGSVGLATGLAAALLQGRQAAALGVVGLAGGLVMALVQARQAASSRDDARRQLAGVKGIVSELVFRYGDAITLLPGGAPAQEAMLKQTVQSLDEALHNAPDDPELIVLMSSALGRLAQLQGNPAFAAPERAGEAQATVARALELASRVWPAKCADWRFVCQHLVTLITRAQLLRGQGEPAQGLEVLALAAERCGQALASSPPDAGRAQLLDLRANIWISSAQFNDHSGRPSLQRPQQALEHYGRAEADFRLLYATPALVAALDQASTPGDPRAEEFGRHNIANAHAGRALVHQRLEDWAAMRADCEAALALRRLNLQANPHSVTWRQSAMFDSHTLAVALLRLAEPAAALAAVQPAWDTAAALLREAGNEAAGSPWAATPANFAAAYARALAANGRHAEALPVYDLGLQRLAQQPGVASRCRLAWLQIQRAWSVQALGDDAGATTAAAAAAAELQTLRDDSVLAREATLALAEAQALLAASTALPQPRRRQAALAARAAFDAAQAWPVAGHPRPLSPEHVALRDRLPS